jgi:hypothetical protein
VIISVGYWVKSPQGTQFRMWATQRLREYIVKGFAFLRKQAGLSIASLSLANAPNFHFKQHPKITFTKS